MRPLILGTRGSSLAMCQVQIVQTLLEEREPSRPVKVQPIRARADKAPETPLAALQGEGVFVKELEQALLDGEIDAAVHSMKDVPLDQPAGLRIAAVLEREEPQDALVSRSGAAFERLPAGARVGTSSLRRKAQVLRRRRDLDLRDIRGNVDTRLRKLDEGQYEAIIVAACGLVRLGLGERITEYLSLEWMLPEPGQGCLAVQARAEDGEVIEALRALDDPASRACVEAERAFLRGLGGGCRLPIAAHASMAGGELALQGAVVAPDGRAELRGAARGPMTEPVALGQRLAEQLISQGALKLLVPQR